MRGSNKYRICICILSVLSAAQCCARGGNNGETSVRYGALGGPCLPPPVLVLLLIVKRRRRRNRSNDYHADHDKDDVDDVDHECLQETKPC